MKTLYESIMDIDTENPNVMVQAAIDKIFDMRTPSEYEQYTLNELPTIIAAIPKVKLKQHKKQGSFYKAFPTEIEFISNSEEKGFYITDAKKKLVLIVDWSKYSNSQHVSRTGYSGFSSKPEAYVFSYAKDAFEIIWNTLWEYMVKQ